MIKSIILLFTIFTSIIQFTFQQSKSNDHQDQHIINVYNTNQSLPKNTRHLIEGYWIGSIPKSIFQIEELYNQGIRLIITVTHTSPSFNKIISKIKSLQMTHLYIPIGSRFPSLTQEQISIIESYNPNQIFVHCEHGSDRSGTFIAYLLIKYHNYSIPSALLSVVSRNKKDISLLKDLLHKHSIPISDDDIAYTSIYAGKGGLKLRGDSYQRLVETMIDHL